jgi:hypothetical protein
MGSFPPSGGGFNDAKRRSERLLLKTSVIVFMRGEDNKLISEETRTLTVSAHGAMVLLSMKVSNGQLVRLHNTNTGEEALCRVVYVSPHEREKREVGLDFAEPRPQFWKVAFPPADWTTQSPEAKDGASRPKAPRADSNKNNS